MRIITANNIVMRHCKRDSRAAREVLDKEEAGEAEVFEAFSVAELVAGEFIVDKFPIKGSWRLTDTDQIEESQSKKSESFLSPSSLLTLHPSSFFLYPSLFLVLHLALFFIVRIAGKPRAEPLDISD